MQTHSSDLFHFDTQRADDGSLIFCEITSEWSMLQGHVDCSKIAIRSTVTGAVVEFRRVTQEFFDEEVVSDKYVPINSNKPITLEIFND